MTARPRGGLGRGIAALIPTGPGEPGAVPPGATFREILVDAVRPNPRQPRADFDPDQLAELVASVREVGVLQPVVVRPVADGFELVMGERRWRAAVAAGLATIPAVVRDTGDDVMLRDALIENLHRQQLNPLEEAAAYEQLLADFGATHDELAARVGRSRSHVTNTIRLLRLPPTVQRRIAAGVLSAGHARALLALDDPAAQDRLAGRIVAEGLSVRAVEEIVALTPTRGRVQVDTGGLRVRQRPELFAVVEERLSDALETRVTVEGSLKRGRVIVDYAGAEDLARLADAIEPAARAPSNTS